MINAIDLGFPFRYEARDDKARGGPQIRGHHSGTREGGNALDDRRVTIDLDLGAKSA
jgi:hypothetical protein